MGDAVRISVTPLQGWIDRHHEAPGPRQPPELHLRHERTVTTGFLCGACIEQMFGAKEQVPHGGQSYYKRAHATGTTPDWPI